MNRWFVVLFVAFAMLSILVYNASRNRHPAKIEQVDSLITLNSASTNDSTTTETNDSIRIDWDRLLPRSTRESRIRNADAIRANHEPEIIPLIENVYNELNSILADRSYRYTNNENHIEHVRNYLLSEKAVRDRERLLWDELSGLLTPDELFRYKYKHSYFGKEIANYSNALLPKERHYPEEQLMAVYRGFDARYELMDLHFEGMEYLEARFIDDVVDGVYRPNDPEYDIFMEIMELPLAGPEELDGREPPDWDGARKQILFNKIHNP